MRKPEQIINFRIKAIDVVQYSLNPCPAVDVGEDGYSFNIEIQQKIDLPNKLVFVIVAIKISLTEKFPGLATLSTLCVFDVENLSDIVQKEQNQYLLPAPAATTLNSIALSTTRGIMYSNLKGTYLQNAILPIVDPTTFVRKQDI